MSLNDSLTQLIESPIPRALVLQGTWGRGKTHLWRMIWSEYVQRFQKEEKKLTRYSYVSLFGLNSLDELKQAIFESNEELLVQQETIAEGAGIAGKTKRFFSRNTPKVKKTGALLANSTDISGGWISGSLGNAYRAFSFFRVRDMLVCLDDIERRGDGLRLLDVLGLISLLWEQRGCRVLIIMNNKSFSPDDEQVWEKNKEKVFQSEITFSPSTEECVEIIFRGAQQSMLRSEAKRSLIDLKVTNIRIVERVRSFVEQIEVVTRKLAVSKETQATIARCLVLAVYCHSGRGEGAPPLDYAIKYNALNAMFSSKEKQEKSEEQQFWDEELRSYRFDIADDIDREVVRAVRRGYLDNSSLVSAIEAADASVDSRNLKDNYSNAWRMWHDWFSDNRDSVVNAFRESFPAAAGEISSINADGTIRLMREIGENTLADEFVRVWIDARRSDRIEELSIKSLNHFEKITDEALIQGAASAYLHEKILLPLSQAMSRLGKHEGHSHEVAEAIASIDANELFDYLISNPGEETQAAISACLNLGGDHRNKNYHLAANKAKEAIRLIAAISPFNDLRMRKRYPAVMLEESDQQTEADD